MRWWEKRPWLRVDTMTYHWDTWIFSSLDEETESRGPVSPLALQEQLLWCHTTETAGACVRLPHQGPDCDGKVGRSLWHQHRDLGRQSPFLQGPRGDPNQQLRSCAGPILGHSLTRDLGGVQVCLIQILRLVLLALEPSLLTARQGAGWQPHLL